jgi:aldehyde dehydrogenase (NAD+)
MYREQIANLLGQCGIQGDVQTLAAWFDGNTWHSSPGQTLPQFSPIDGSPIGQMQRATEEQCLAALDQAEKAAAYWARIPAPQRGEVVRQIGEAFRQYKTVLATLLTIENGKILQEALGEIQEVIDIADFAVGLSRQLYGLTMPSERPSHRMYEQWHPLGVVGVITAFNFPAAVWAWNALPTLVCGNATLWKPSEKTPYVAAACAQIATQVLARNNHPVALVQVLNGDAAVGKRIAEEPRVQLVSATGSTRMGKAVAETVGRRLGKSLLELGGNNAIIISQHADIPLALQATVFAAVGTCGQRCTTARRLIIHESIYETVREKLTAIYRQLQSRIGNPLEPSVLIGPLIDTDALAAMHQTLAEARAAGANVLIGGEPAVNAIGTGAYVTPCLVEADNAQPFVQRETFAPILYLMKYRTLEEAIALNNGVKQGLSSSLFTLNMREAEAFLSAQGSDCGIANINIGPSGAEIGGAFGGEKETGGGRESGSDAWKAYMRRQTVTINYSNALPLAQGIRFDVE